MAITSKNRKAPAPLPLVKDYADILRRRALRISISASILATLATAGMLIISESLPHSMPVIWIIAGTAGLISLGASLLFIASIGAPAALLLRAVAHVSGEPLADPAPNPHEKHYAKTGLSTALQAIYSLDSSAGAHTKSEAPVTSSMIDRAPIDRMHGAIISLNSSRRIAYASNQAPLHTVDGILQPQLLFNGTDSLTAWLDECEETTVKAEKCWQRIPDRTADQEDRHIFDVYASYEKGAAHETVLTLIDMTDKYQVDEQDLNFIAFAAHELRGPITVIRGYIDVLQDELADIIADDQQELFYRLSVSASRLSSYVNNILNTSRYDRRHLSLTLIPDTFANVYATISDDMALRANSQNRLLTVSVPEDLPQIAADRASLSEVLSNIVDNAIKYSNEGGTVTVTAAQNGDFVDIQIEDQGIGMPSNVTKNIFQKFYRSHRSRETVAGSGIGLYISKAIVESHGGMISVRSKEGRGSVFTISIPTYASVADKLIASDGSNQNLIKQGSGWIKNHTMYRG